MAGNTNVSSLIPSSINNTLSQISNPKSFGDQLINSNVSKIKSSSLGKIEELNLQIQNLINQIINLDVEHAKNLNDLLQKTLPTPPQSPVLTLEEYQQAVINENNNYKNEKALLQNEKISLQQKLQNLLNDPYKHIKSQTAKTKKRISLKFNLNNTKTNIEFKALSKSVLKNASKTLASIVALQATKLLFNITDNNSTIQGLIDNTNSIIDSAQTQQDIDKARVLRNSTLSIVNDNRRKLNSLDKIITNTNKVVTVLNISLRVITLLFTIPKPFGLGPTMPTPIQNKVKKLQDLLLALNILLSILQSILDSELNELNNLQNQLDNIGALLDTVALNNLSNAELQSLINNLQNQSSTINASTFPEYKGFKFAIKEEETIGAQQAIVVRGNIKRRYAVAINKDGVEVLKSELSFTLDPPDLVEQLKLIIDQQNLQG